MKPENLQVGDLVMVQFPGLNNNDRIADNQAALADCFNVNRCRIAKVIEVDAAEFDQIANDYLNDRPDLWEGIGGAELDPADRIVFNQLAVAHGIDPEADFAPFQEPLRGFFMGACRVPVVMLKAPGRPLQFVNSEGYAYARYVGELMLAALPPCVCCGAPADHGVNDVKIGQRYACAQHYGEVRQKADYHQREAANQKVRIEGDLYEAGLDGVVLARKVKAALRKLAPGAAWSVKAERFQGPGVRVELIGLPPGMALMAPAGEEPWEEVAGGYVPFNERGWSQALGQLMAKAEEEAQRFNCRVENSCFPEFDWAAYRFWVAMAVREVAMAA